MSYMSWFSQRRALFPSWACSTTLSLVRKPPEGDDDDAMKTLHAVHKVQYSHGDFIADVTAFSDGFRFFVCPLPAGPPLHLRLFNAYLLSVLSVKRQLNRQTNKQTNKEHETTYGGSMKNGALVFCPGVRAGFDWDVWRRDFRQKGNKLMA